MGNIYIFVLTHGGKYVTPHPRIPLPLYEGYVSVKRNITYKYYGNNIQRLKTLHYRFKVYGGSDLPNIQ